MMMQYFRQIELALARIGLLAIVVIILAGGISRAFGHPVIWSLEIAMVCFAWVSMLAIDYAMQNRRHIGIDALVRLFPPQMQRLCLWINELLILGFLICGVWFGYSFTWTTHHQVLPITEISLAWLNSAVPTGCLLMLITTVNYLLQGCPQSDNREETQ